MWYALMGMAWHGMVFSMAWRAWHWEKVWPGGHGIVYGMALRCISSHMVLSGGHDMVCGMARWAWHVLWYGLAGIAWPGNAWHGIWYDLAGMAWYMAWPGVHGMVYGMAL